MDIKSVITCHCVCEVHVYAVAIYSPCSTTVPRVHMEKTRGADRPRRSLRKEQKYLAFFVCLNGGVIASLEKYGLEARHVLVETRLVDLEELPTTIEELTCLHHEGPPPPHLPKWKPVELSRAEARRQSRKLKRVASGPSKGPSFDRRVP